MPNGDGTGPYGNGPRMGKGFGPCGYGRRGGRGWFPPEGNFPPGVPYPPQRQPFIVSKEEEKRNLEYQLQMLDADRAILEKRIKELEK